MNESFTSMTCNLSLDPAFAIDLPGNDILGEKHYDMLEPKGDFITIDQIWEDFETQTQWLEKEILLVQCIHGYWQSKRKDLSPPTEVIDKINEKVEELKELLKRTVIDMCKVEETYTLSIYKIWVENFSTLKEIISEIQTTSGVALSYLLGNKILDELYYIAEDDKRFEKTDQQIYGKSFDILTLLGAFEKPISTHEKIKSKIEQR